MVFHSPICFPQALLDSSLFLFQSLSMVFHSPTGSSNPVCYCFRACLCFFSQSDLLPLALLDSSLFLFQSLSIVFNSRVSCPGLIGALRIVGILGESPAMRYGLWEVLRNIQRRGVDRGKSQGVPSDLLWIVGSLREISSGALWIMGSLTEFQRLAVESTHPPTHPPMHPPTLLGFWKFRSGTDRKIAVKIAVLSRYYRAISAFGKLGHAVPGLINSHFVMVFYSRVGYPGLTSVLSTPFCSCFRACHWFFTVRLASPGALRP